MNRPFAGILCMSLFISACNQRQQSEDIKPQAASKTKYLEQDSVGLAQLHLQEVARVAQRNKLQIACAQLRSFLKRSMSTESKNGKELRQFYSTFGEETSSEAAELSGLGYGHTTQVAIWKVACNLNHVHEIRVKFANFSDYRTSPLLSGEATEASIDGVPIDQMLDLTDAQIRDFVNSIPGKKVERIEKVLGSSDSDLSEPSTVMGDKKVQRVVWKVWDKNGQMHIIKVTFEANYYSEDYALDKPATKAEFVER